MTLRCEVCDCVDLELTHDNGASYPQTRVEWFECVDCGHEQQVVLTA